MNLKKLVLLVTLLTPFLSKAQIPTIPTNNDFKCGINPQTAALIEQRLMDNRQLFTRQEVQDLTSKRSITYIPLTITNVADTSGIGRTSEQTILGFLCGLNAIYADQNVQFFIHGTIRNRESTYIYNNAGTPTARGHMLTYRVPNTLNLIIGSSINNPVASWYDGFGDFVFLLKQMLTSEAKTEAHEIGHFFTLPHTFYGWENKDVEALYGGQNVPQFSWIERADRTGPLANCHTTADKFCDTPADYYSDRKNCPYIPTVSDPNGNAIDPDESNIMSYAFDACVTNFSTEQKNAIAMDIASRTWVTNTPTNTATVTGIPTAVSPLNNGQLGDINNSTVRLEWTPVTGATMYYLEVYTMQFFGLWVPNTNSPIHQGIIYSANPYFDLPTDDLVVGSRYAWRVKALNSVSTCATVSSYSAFEAVTSVATNLKDLPIEKQMTFTVNSNPITTSFIPLSIYSAEEVIGSIRIYGMDGRIALDLTKQLINEGESLVQLPADGLANGMYIAVLFTERGQLQQKIILQR
ncbi:zinc-dependent metalloprotease [Aureispira anguillae]|uniref:Zinc-dependent metalloprotease n=1 Tax=Aureispira anguillae TaxID=2864201 RepID=A0A916DSK7_9BACT|nr:zinc-dependent metalloprotease [Aureispira anguillae]BDS12594.1 zinc-dependent metalloprotease [Aureispira anguillae]